jgi:predicted alpha/beta superfamily hydrolase
MRPKKAAAFTDYEVQSHSIASRFVAQTYRIRVLLPMRRADESERFPVVYATDGDDLFDGLAVFSKSLQLHGETPRFILVGIGYEPAGAAAVLRWRDFATPDIRVRFEQELRAVAESPLVSGLDDFGVVSGTTDARDFLRFICEELMPFVNERYPTVPDDTCYSGYSAGGTFGLLTLFTQPQSFGRYILGSAATSYDGEQFMVPLAREFSRSGAALNAKVFLSVGELEEFKRGLEQFDLVSGYTLLAKFLALERIPGLDLTLRLFPNETHASAWGPAFSHGLRAVFGPADQVPYSPDYRK